MLLLDTGELGKAVEKREGLSPVVGYKTDTAELSPFTGMTGQPATFTYHKVR